VRAAWVAVLTIASMACGRSSVSDGFFPGSIEVGFDAGPHPTDAGQGGDAGAASCSSSQLFLAAVTYSAGPSAFGIAVADFDGNGTPDVAVIDSTEDQVSILMGLGQGTLDTPVHYPAGGNGWSMAAADFDSDGIMDLVVANGSSTTISVVPGLGDGGFGAPRSYPSGDGPNTVLAIDLNNDGVLDAVVSNYGGSGTVSVLIGDPDGGFADPVSYSVGASAIFVVAADFDRDGKLDLVAASQGASMLSLLSGRGDGTFAAAQAFGSSAGSGPTAIGVGDFNGDGWLDTAVSDWYGNSVAILTGPANASEQPTVVGLGPNANSVAVADFNGDGILDLAVAEANGFSSTPPGIVDVLLGKGDGTFTLAAQLDVGAAPVDVVAADLNGDGKPDLVVANQSGSVSVLLNGCP
jgi:FG-GAP-like repeat